MNYESLIVGVQWAIIGFFVLFHFIIGFNRGTKKSLYYTIVSFVLTFVLLFGVSFLTIRSIFTPGSLLQFIERFATIPENIRVYLVEPELSAVLFAIIDLVVRIVAFIVLYPVVKWLLTLLIFRPIYRSLIDKSHQQHTLQIKKYKGQPEFIIKPKKRNINIFSRVGGAALGAVRGFVVAFVLLLPIIMLGSISRGLEGEHTTEENINKLEATFLSNGTNNDSNDFLEILRTIQSVDEYGMGQFTKGIKIGSKTLDQAVFDFVFTTDIVTKDTSTELVVSDEIQNFGAIATILIEKGYLESDFNIETINYEDHYEDIEFILNNIGKSNLVNSLFAAGVDVASKHLLPDMLGFDPNASHDAAGNKLHTKDVIEALKLIDLSSETDSIAKAIEQALLLGSVGDLLAISEDPKLFLELTVEEQRQVSKILHEISNLELLVGANLAIEALIRMESVHEKLDWVDNPVEYLQDQLSFILNNNRNFIGNDGDIAAIANLVSAMFADEFADFDYTQFGGDLTPEFFLSEEVSPVISAALINIVEVNTILQLLPLGVDYFVYGTKPELIEQVSDDIVSAFDDANYRNEILNIDSIYKLIVQLGLEAYFEDEADVIAITDSILSEEDSILAVREIVHHLFEGSQVVNEVLTIVAEPLVDSIVDDEDVKQLALKVVGSDIHYGTEINKLLNLVESAYSFTTITDVMNTLDIGDMDAYLNLAADFGSMDEDDFNQFKLALTSLHTFEIIGIDLLELVKEKADIEQIIIPTDASLNYDLIRTLDLLYEVAKPLNIERAKGVDVLDINLSEALDGQKLSEILRFTEADKNSILLASAVEFIKTLELDLGELGEVTIPIELLGRHFNDPIWINELNNITTGSFRTIGMLQHEDFILSYNHLTNNVKGLEDIPAELVARFGVLDVITEGSLGLIFNSMIVRANATTIGQELLNDALADQNFSINLPELAIGTDGYLMGSALTELVFVAAQSTIYLEEDILNVNMQELLDNITAETAVRGFNSMPYYLLGKIGESKIVNGVFRDAILNEDLQNIVYDELSELELDDKLSPINNITSGVFDFDVALVNGEVPLNTLYDLLVGVQKLQVPVTLISEPNNENIMNFLEDVDPESLISVIEIKLIHELLDNVIKLNEVKDVGENFFDDLLIQLDDQGYALNLDYNNYYNVINLANDTDGLLAISEVRDFIDVLKALQQVVDFDDLDNVDILATVQALETINVGINNGYEVITKPVLLRGLIGTALNDQVVLDFAADFITTTLEESGNININIDGDTLKLSQDFFTNNVVLTHNHFYDLLLAVMAQDTTLIDRKFDIEVSDITNLLNDGLSITELNRLEQAYNSEIIEFVLKSVIEHDEAQKFVAELVNEQILNLANEMEINPTYINEEDLDLNFDLINLDAMTKAIIALDELNINDFNELTNIKSINDLGLLLNLRNTKQLANNIFEIPLILHALEVVLTSDTLGNMAKEIVDTKLLTELPINVTAPSAETYKLDSSLITTDNFVDLVLALYGANIDIDEFDNSTLNIIDKLLGYKMANRVENQGIRHLYNSDIINHFISLVGENEEVHQVAVELINHYLGNFEDELDVNLPTITQDDLALNNSLFDVEAAVLMLTFVKDLELNDISELTEVKTIKAFGELLNLRTDDKLVNQLADIPVLYHVYERLLLSEFGTELVAVLVNEKLLPMIDANIDPIDKNEFKLDATVVNKASFRNLFIAVYGANIDVDTDFNDVVGIASKLGAGVIVANETKRAIEFVYGFDVIPHVLKNLVEHETIQTELLDLLNDQLNSLDLNAIRPVTKEELNITFELFNSTAMVKTLDAFNALRIDTLDDLKNAKTISEIGMILRLNENSETVNKVFNVPLLDHALTVVLTNDMLSEVIKELVDTKVIPELPFTVNIPEAEAYKINQEFLTTENYVDLVVSIYGSGIEIDDRNVLTIIDKLLTDKLSGGVTMKGIEHLYNNKIVNELLGRIENEEIATTLTDITNGYIDKLADIMDVNPVHITNDELNINKSLLDVDAAILMLTAVNELDLSSFKELTGVKTLNQAFELLQVEETNENVLNVMNIPIVLHVFNILFTTDVIPVMGHEYASRELPEAIALNVNDFRFDPELITPEDLTDLVMGAYGSGLIGSKNLSTPALFTDLTNEYRAGGVELLGIEHIVNARIIHDIVDQLLTSDGLREAVVNELNKLLVKANINTTIETPDVTRLPMVALDEDGRISKDEFVLVVKAFAALNLDSYSQLTSIKGVSDVVNLITRDTLDTLLESELVYYYVGLVPFGVGSRRNLANIINEELKLPTPITESDLTLYGYDGIFNPTGAHNGYVSKAEIGLILDAVQGVNLENLLFSGNIYNIINRAVDVLLADDAIDLFFESKLLSAGFDKLVNVENTAIEQVYTELINRTLFKALDVRFTEADNILALHEDALTNEGLIDPFEFKRLLETIQYLNLSKGSNLNVLLDLVDRNLDINDEDDFDRAFNSVVLKSLITNALDSETYEIILVKELNKVQNKIEVTEEHIALPDEIFIDGLISSNEIKALLRTLRALDLGDLKFAKVGLSSFFDLVDGNIENGRDDFDRMLDSIVIHNIIDRLFKSDELGNFVGELVSDMFNKDVPNVDMTPADKLLDANGMFAKVEIKAIFVSIKLLEATTLADLEAMNLIDLIGLIGKNEEAGVDDLHRFLASGYIATTMSKLLNSKTIREQIAQGGKFDAEDLNLTAAKDADGYITEIELYNLFAALNVLGVEDVNNMEISNETLKALTSDELDLVLEAAFMYQVVDLTLKAQLDDIPEASLVVDTNDKFFGYINKLEVSALIETLTILNIDDAGAINTNTITIQMLEDLVGLNSSIVNRLLSTELLTINNLEVPEDSLENSGKDIKGTELMNIINTLAILANGNKDTLIEDIDTDVLTQLQYEALLVLETDSPFVSRLISKAIIESFENVPTESFIVDSNEFIIRTEMEKLNDVLTILGITAIDNEGFNLDDITVANLSEIHDLDSPLFRRLISQSIIDANITTNDSVEANGLDIKVVEIDGLILAMELAGITNISKVKEELTLAQIRLIDPTEQVLIYQDTNTTIIYNMTSDLLIEELVTNDYDLDVDALEFLDATSGLIRRDKIIDALNHA